jgi:hypothetical protein
MWLASETVAHAFPFRLNQILRYTHTNSGIVFQSFGSSESIREAPKEHLIIRRFQQVFLGILLTITSMQRGRTVAILLRYDDSQECKNDLDYIQ